MLEQPYGNPGSLGEPLGIWSGAADVAGDATGGFVSISFEPRNPVLTPTLDDARRQYVYFADGVSIVVPSSLDVGFMSASYETHWARANVAITLGSRWIMSAQSINIGNTRTSLQPLHAPEISRFPMYWDPQDLDGVENRMVTLRIQTNDILALYQGKAWGRYYDRQILANRAFSRLVSPAAISQF